jgi:hypothetical protein
LYKQKRLTIPLEDIIEQMRNDITIAARSPSASEQKYLAFDISFAYFDRIKASQAVQALITRFQESNRARQQASAYEKRHRTYDEVDRMEARLLAIEKKLGIGAPPESSYTSPLDAPILLYVLDAPSLPIDPVYPDRAHFMETGLGAGFLSALIIAVYRRKLPPIPYPAQTA